MNAGFLVFLWFAPENTHKYTQYEAWCCWQINPMPTVFQFVLHLCRACLWPADTECRRLEWPVCFLWLYIKVKVDPGWCLQVYCTSSQFCDFSQTQTSRIKRTLKNVHKTTVNTKTPQFICTSIYTDAPPHQLVHKPWRGSEEGFLLKSTIISLVLEILILSISTRR